MVSFIFGLMRITGSLLGVVALALLSTAALAASKPNILFIMSDDVGITNVSAYSLGLMGYHP
jgi:arylsulfatase